MNRARPHLPFEVTRPTLDGDEARVDVSRDAATPKQPGGETPADSACLLTIVRLLAKAAAHDAVVENNAK